MKRNVLTAPISGVTSILTFFLLYWLACPAFAWQPGFLLILAAALFVGGVVGHIVNGEPTLFSKVQFYVSLTIVAAILVSLIISLKCFHTEAIKNRITIGEISEEELVDSLPEYSTSAYAWQDSLSALKLATRKTGELTDFVSLFSCEGSYSSKTDDDGNVITKYSGVYTNSTENGTVKYVPLGYTRFFSYLKGNSIPGYIAVSNFEAEYVEAEINYSSSAFFSKDLRRAFRKELRTDVFGETSFQVSTDGTPYWVVQLLKYDWSWNVTEVYAIGLMNACTGEVVKYTIGTQPEWVVVYDGNTASEYYDAYGRYINGWWNPSKAGETMVTDDFGYVTIDGTMFYYTGVTSRTMTGDESNIGLLLYNSKTGEALYCQTAGAEEYSAMEAAQGTVQNFGYTASFPSITSVCGELTYTMVLKDSNDIVKCYGMVNYSDYGIVTVGDTVEECAEKYVIASGVEATEEQKDLDASELIANILDIRYINIDGQTWTYVQYENNRWMKHLFDEKDLFISVGDSVTVTTYGSGEVIEFEY